MNPQEIEKALQSIVRLNTNDVCELAMEFLDLNNPDPDKVGDIAERMGMGWDESTEEFLDLENCQLRFHHRQQIYAKNSEIFNKSERIKSLEEAGSNLLQAMNQYSFFLNGYGNGSASLAEVNHANDEVFKAQNVLFELLKTQ